MDWKNQWGGLKTGWAQMVMISGTKPSWRPVTNVSPRSILGPITFNIFMNDLMIEQRLPWLRQIVRSGWYSRGIPEDSKNSKIPQESWQKMGWQEPHEIQQVEVQSLHLRKKNPRLCSWKAAGGCPAGRQLCGEGSGGPAGYQIEYESTACPCHQKKSWYPDLH